MTENPAAPVADATAAMRVDVTADPRVDAPPQMAAPVRMRGEGTARFHAAAAALLVTSVLMVGCSGNSGAGSAGSRLRVYAADIAGNAKICEVPKVDPVAGQTIEAAIKVGNDGGWCGLRVSQDGPKPFAAGLLTTRPGHGSIVIHAVGDDTRIDYTPDHGFSGSDGFAVKLVPGNATVQVAVTVTPPSG